MRSRPVTLDGLEELGLVAATLAWATLAPLPAGAHTLVVTEDSPEPALILFMVEGGLIYLDKPSNGTCAAYEDGFTLLDLCRKYYRESGLDPQELDQLIR